MKYSIIIPHYNRPDLIIKTIESFKDLKDKEILIIDDVSTEENLEKLRSAITEMPDQNIILYESEGGVKYYLSGARNKGLDLAKGEWIYFIDDDDEVTPKFVKWLNKNKQNKKYDFYRFPNIERLDGKNKMYIYKWWHKKYSPQISTYLFDSNFFNETKIRFNTKVPYGEDIFFQMEIFEIKKIKSKYKHLPAFYYNRFSNIETMMKSKKHDPKNHLIWIDEALKTNYKAKKSDSLTFFGIYFQNMYKQGNYENKKDALKIFKEYYDKINPTFKDWWKVNLPWKFAIKSFKKEVKRIEREK